MRFLRQDVLYIDGEGTPENPDFRKSGQQWLIVDEPAQPAVEEVTERENQWLAEGTTPEGDDWRRTDDTKDGQELTPGSPEIEVQELVSEAVSAGPDCPEAPAEKPAVTPVVTEKSKTPHKAKAERVANRKAAAATPKVTQARAATLAHTGSDGSQELLGLAAALLLAGVGLQRVAKRRS